jgi:nucleotide-binding universal stress UspA family protein
MKTILAAIDSSRSSGPVAKAALELAKATRSRLALLTVTPPPVVAPDVPLTMADMSEVSAAVLKAAAVHLGKVRRQVSGRGVTVSALQLEGPPIAQILAHAKKLAASYVVMGSHGHTAVYELLVGSTTHGVLLRARCPVVIVPARKKTR